MNVVMSCQRQLKNLDNKYNYSYVSNIIKDAKEVGPSIPKVNYYEQYIEQCEKRNMIDVEIDRILRTALTIGEYASKGPLKVGRDYYKIMDHIIFSRSPSLSNVNNIEYVDDVSEFRSKWVTEDISPNAVLLAAWREEMAFARNNINNPQVVVDRMLSALEYGPKLTKNVEMHPDINENEELIESEIIRLIGNAGNVVGNIVRRKMGVGYIDEDMMMIKPKNKLSELLETPHIANNKIRPNMAP